MPAALLIIAGILSLGALGMGWWVWGMHGTGSVGTTHPMQQMGVGHDPMMEGVSGMGGGGSWWMVMMVLMGLYVAGAVVFLTVGAMLVLERVEMGRAQVRTIAWIVVVLGALLLPMSMMTLGGGLLALIGGILLLGATAPTQDLRG